MKKIIFMLVLISFFGNKINAQITRTDAVQITTIKEEKEEKEKFWYMRLGVNFMTVTGDYFNKEYINSKLGYQLIFGFEKPMGPLFWGMEFGLGTRGFQAENGGYEFSLLANNSQFSPFNLGYKYQITNEFAVEARLGALVRVDYFGKFKESYGGDSEDWTIYDADDYMPLDAGLQFGFGVWFNKIGLDLLWQKGFINLSTDDEDIKSSNFLIRFGLVF